MQQLVKQVWEMKVKLGNEHCQTFSSRKKLDMDFGELELQIDCAKKGHNDVLKQLKKPQAQTKAAEKV